MTKEQFNEFWTSWYPNTIPVSHFFKHDYAKRWFRIHNLPESKRYPDTENEWKILLARQNQIITDLFGEDSEILLVTGEFNWGERTAFITDEIEVFKPYKFIRLDNIDMYKVCPGEYDEVEIYKSAFSEIIWTSNKYNNLLKEIANDRTRAFFVSIEKNILIAPYDGGIDLILKDNMTRDFFKQKYKEWLSPREDGY